MCAVRFPVVHVLHRRRHLQLLRQIHPGLECWVRGRGFRVQGAGCRVQGSGFRVQECGLNFLVEKETMVHVLHRRRHLQLFREIHSGLIRQVEFGGCALGDSSLINDSGYVVRVVWVTG